MRLTSDRTSVVFVLGLTLALLAALTGIKSMRAQGRAEPASVRGEAVPREAVAVAPTSPARPPAIAIDAATLRTFRDGVLGALRSAANNASAAPQDETALMAELHELAETDPNRSLALARDGNARYPDGPGAPERAWIVSKSLVDLGRFDEAKAEAQAMVAQYPGTSWANDLRRHLLSQPLRPDDVDNP